MSVSNIIGNNIRTARKERQLSLEDVADLMEQHGAENVTGCKVGAWERGERSISAENLLYLSMSLRVSVNYLFYGQTDDDTTNRLMSEIAQCSHRQRETMLYSAVHWDGNSHALMEWVRMYMSTPRKYRADIAGLAINQYRHLLHENIIKPQIDVDIKLLQDELNKIDRE